MNAVVAGRWLALDTTWNVTGLNAGTAGPVSFNTVENLAGGGGGDTFAFAAGKAVTGTINGGTGADRLDYSAFTAAVRVNRATGAATADCHRTLVRHMALLDEIRDGAMWTEER